MNEMTPQFKCFNLELAGWIYNDIGPDSIIDVHMSNIAGQLKTGSDFARRINRAVGIENAYRMSRIVKAC